MPMTLSKLFLVAVAGLTLASCQQTDSREQVLVKEYYAESDACRGGDPALAETWRACERRNSIVYDLVNHGYCWGEEGQEEYQRSWKKCS